MKWLWSLSFWGLHRLEQSTALRRWYNCSLSSPFLEKLLVFAPLSLSLPFCSAGLIKRRRHGGVRAARPCSENTLLFLFVPWKLKLERCFPASWWPDYCGNCLRDVSPFTSLMDQLHRSLNSEAPVIESLLNNLRERLSPFQKHKEIHQYTQERTGSRGAIIEIKRMRARQHIQVKVYRYGTVIPVSSSGSLMEGHSWRKWLWHNLVLKMSVKQFLIWYFSAALKAFHLS